MNLVLRMAMFEVILGLTEPAQPKASNKKAKATKVAPCSCKEEDEAPAEETEQTEEAAGVTLSVNLKRSWLFAGTSFSK